MPVGTRVHDCVDKLKKQGKEEGSAIAICQSSTHQSFASGKPIKKKSLVKHSKVKCGSLQEARKMCKCGGGCGK